MGINHSFGFVQIRRKKGGVQIMIKSKKILFGYCLAISVIFQAASFPTKKIDELFKKFQGLPNAKAWNFDLDNGVWNNTKPSCSNWYAWKNGDAIGSMNTTLIGNGTMTINFGNCWSSGNVKVYLDGSEMASAGPGESKEASFDYKDGSKLEISEINGGIIQINEITANDERFWTFLDALKNRSSDAEKMQFLQEEGVEIVNELLKMAEKTLEEVDDLLEKSDAEMDKLRESYAVLDLQESEFMERLLSKFRNAKTDLLKARVELVSLASDTVHFCKKIENGIEGRADEFAAILHKVQFKQIMRFLKNSKTKLMNSKEKYGALLKTWLHIKDDLATFQAKVKKQSTSNEKQYKETMSEIRTTKHDLKAWRIGLIFADIFGCFGFCSTLVYNKYEAANYKIDTKVEAYEDEMRKMLVKVNDAFETFKKLDKIGDASKRALTLELMLVISWESAANGLKDTVEDLSEYSPDQLKKITSFRLTFANSVSKLKLAAKQFLNFVSPDDPSLQE